MSAALAALRRALAARFADPPRAEAAPGGVATLARMAGRGSHRRFTDRAVGADVLELLCAVALSAPTKSDLQQRDIVVVRDPAVRRAIDRLVADQDWIAEDYGWMEDKARQHARAERAGFGAFVRGKGFKLD